MIYFDNAASMPLNESVLGVLTKAFKDDFANSKAQHALGKSSDKQLEMVRNGVLEQLGLSDEYTLLFTSSATEANNQAINHIKKLSEGDVYLDLSSHASLIKPCERYFLNIADFKDIETSGGRIKAACLTHVNSASGEIAPVKADILAVKRLNSSAYVHIDGVQAFGKIPDNLNELDFDSYSFSSHKLGGPKGVGGLIFKKNKMSPLLYGGGQEMDLRSSTVAVPLILGFYEAFKSAYKNLETNFEKALVLKKEILDGLSNLEIDLIFPFEKTSPYIISIVVPKIPSDVLLRHLEIEKVFVSSSSACSSKVKGENSTFLALGLDKKYHKNVLRISTGFQNTKEDAAQFLKVFKEVITDLQDLID